MTDTDSGRSKQTDGWTSSGTRHPASPDNLPFAETLRDAMARIGVGQTAVARELGIAVTTVDNWLNRGSLPALPRVTELAEFLVAPRLVQIVMRATSRRCRRCQARFYAHPRTAYKAMYCGSACKRAATRARRSKSAMSKRRLSVMKLERAITAFCRGCEPEGMCRDAVCPLRSVSPFPLVARRAA